MERLAELFERLQALVAIPATSGFEQEIARRLLEEMQSLADRVEVDVFGNVNGTVDGAPGGPRGTGGWGRETARRLLEEMQSLADRVEVDVFGNVNGTVDGAPGGPRV